MATKGLQVMLRADNRRELSTKIVSALALCMFFSLACGEDYSVDFFGQEDFEAAVGFEAYGDELQNHFSPDPDGMGYLLDDVAADLTTFDRVAIMIDSEVAPVVDVRVFGGAGRGWSEWMPTSITWSESIAHNAHADIPHGGTHVQLRLRSPEPRQVSFLHLEGFILETEGPDDDDQGGLGTGAYALAADKAVDVNRAGWNARAARCSSRTTFTKITIHHTATPNNDSLSMPARMRQMQSYHMDNRAYCDIGYHFLVGQDGKVYQGRAEHFLGGHVLKNNSRNAGVSFIGTFTNAAPSSSVMSAGAKALSAIGCHYDISLSSETVKGHRDYARGNECPGTALYNKLSDLISDAAALSCEGGPSGGGEPGTGEQGVGTGTALLQGKVHEAGDTNKTIGGARVSVGGRQAITDGDGFYSLLVSAGTHTIEASASGYQAASVRRQVTADGETWVSIPLQREGTGGSRGNLVGVIFEAPNSSRRIAGATVRLSNGATAITGSNGYFSIGAPAGTYTMTVSASGYQSASATRQVRAGSDTWGCLGLRKLQAHGTIVGAVHEDGYTNLRIAGALVTLSTGETATSGSDGSFRFEVAPGTYRISAAKDGYATNTIVRAVENGAETQAPIGLSEAAGATGELMGVVYVMPDMAERVAGARVWTSDGQSTFTDADGIYVLHDVPAGDISVYAGKEGYLSGSVARSLEPGQRLWASVPLSLEAEEEEEPNEDEIRVISPTAGERTGSDPEFVWENISEEISGGESFSYHLSIVSRDGIYVFDGSVEGAVDGENRTTLGLSLRAGEWIWAIYAITDDGEVLAASAMHDFEV